MAFSTTLPVTDTPVLTTALVTEMAALPTEAARSTTAQAGRVASAAVMLSRPSARWVVEGGHEDLGMGSF